MNQKSLLWLMVLVHGHFAFATNGAGAPTAPTNPTTAAPTVTFTANPTTVISGSLSTLTYSSTNATSCTGTGFLANGTSGTVKVTPTADTTYLISCTDTGGKASASVSVAVSTEPAAGLFMGLSFQNLTLIQPTVLAGGNAWSEITSGSDFDTVYNLKMPRYPDSPWGGAATYTDKIQTIESTLQDYTRTIETDTTVPVGVSNRVLNITYVNAQVNVNQNLFVTQPPASGTQGMIYFRKWIWLQDDLASRVSSDYLWMMINETKTGGNDAVGTNGPERFGMGINDDKSTDNEPKWYVSHDDWVNGEYIAYAYSVLSPTPSGLVAGQTHAAPIPLGHWFKLESAWNRNYNGKGMGWIWMALTDPESTDPALQAGVQVFFQTGALSYSWTSGVTSDLGWGEARSDLIDRIFPFGAYSNLERSSVSPYTMKFTNIEMWTAWPPDATSHPAGYN